VSSTSLNVPDFQGMREERWTRMLDHVRAVRARPTFDDFERGYRLDVAAQMRAVLELAVSGEPWLPRFRAVTTSIVRHHPYDLTQRTHEGWFVRTSDAEALGRSLACFLDTSRAPVERFEAFVQAAAKERPGLLSPPADLANRERARYDGVLALGSLFNFAVAPEELPVIRPRLFDLLEQTLGYEWTYRISLPEQYVRHVSFADHVRERLAGAGIPVRDMVDVQSLIQAAATEADFWAAEPRPAGPRRYLSICAIYRNEAPYLREWIEFHRLAGVEHFYLYDNVSDDDHLEQLAPYLAEGVVTLRPWPVFDPQVPAYNDCLRWHRYDSRWIAFIDIDEFLFSPGGQPLPEVLSGYEAWPGVAVAWVMFGTGGHRTQPPGLVIENYLHTMEPPDPVMNMKSIVDPTRVAAYASAHHAVYPYMSAVDEQGFPVDDHTIATPSYEHLRLNHYHCKSEEELLAKFERWRTMGTRPSASFQRFLAWGDETPSDAELEAMRREEANGATDETILQFVPAVRAALSEVER
jgi:hypothetical protein